MACLIVTSKRLVQALAAVCTLISPLLHAEITHTQLEFYDFATDKQEAHTIKTESQEPGVVRFTTSAIGEEEKSLVNDYRLCLNKAGTQGYFRMLSDGENGQLSGAEVPLLAFSQEQDLHLSVVPVPTDRRLVYFADTTVLWIADPRIALQSSPDCKH